MSGQAGAAVEAMPEAPPTHKPQNLDGEDFSNYFCAYGYLYNQKEMLEDPVRMAAYYESIIGNHRYFKDKVVLDVGTGSGVLAIWAAQAGARKVYAVEATFMAEHAAKLIEGNGLGDKIEVIQAPMEDVELPEKVDVIVSEWMGYFLLRESMLDSVIVARDKWLKPDGAMFPSHATLYIAPSFDHSQERRDSEFDTAQANWGEFISSTASKYGVDFNPLSTAYKRECFQYFMETALWVDAHPSQMVGQPVDIMSFDLLTLTLEELREPKAGEATMSVTKISDQNPEFNAILGWFTADFRGPAVGGLDTVVQLTTAPSSDGATHWGQQEFHVVPGIPADNGDVYTAKWEIRRQKGNQRLLEIDFDVDCVASQAADAAVGNPARSRKLRFQLN